MLIKIGIAFVIASAAMTLFIFLSALVKLPPEVGTQIAMPVGLITGSLTFFYMETRK